jgi:hypothetical protein
MWMETLFGTIPTVSDLETEFAKRRCRLLGVCDVGEWIHWITVMKHVFSVGLPTMVLSLCLNDSATFQWKGHAGFVILQIGPKLSISSPFQHSAYFNAYLCSIAVTWFRASSIGFEQRGKFYNARWMMNHGAILSSFILYCRIPISGHNMLWCWGMRHVCLYLVRGYTRSHLWNITPDFAFACLALNWCQFDSFRNSRIIFEAVEVVVQTLTVHRVQSKARQSVHFGHVKGFWQ